MGIQSHAETEMKAMKTVSIRFETLQRGEIFEKYVKKTTQETIWRQCHLHHCWTFPIIEKAPIFHSRAFLFVVFPTLREEILQKEEINFEDSA